MIKKGHEKYIEKKVIKLAKRLNDQIFPESIRELMTLWQGWHFYDIAYVIDGANVVVSGAIDFGPDNRPSDQYIINLSEKACRTIVPTIKFVDPLLKPMIDYSKTSTEYQFASTGQYQAPVPKDHLVGAADHKSSKYPTMTDPDTGITVMIAKIKIVRNEQTDGTTKEYPEVTDIRTTNGILPKK